MKPVSDILPEDLQALALRQFDLPAIDEGLTMEAFRDLLAAYVAKLLDQNLSFLLSLLYRIDVREPEVKRVLTFSPPETLPLDLADLILARLFEKLKYRAQYRNEI